MRTAIDDVHASRVGELKIKCAAGGIEMYVDQTTAGPVLDQKDFRVAVGHVVRIRAVKAAIFKGFKQRGPCGPRDEGPRPPDFMCMSSTTSCKQVSQKHLVSFEGAPRAVSTGTLLCFDEAES